MAETVKEARTSALDSRAVLNYAEATDGYAKAAGRLLTLVTAEGIWIGSAYLTWRITGRVKVDSFEGKLRGAMVQTLKTMGDVLGFTVPVVDFAPFRFAAAMIDPWHDELRRLDGPHHFAKMELEHRIMAVLILPSLIRLAVQIASDLVRAGGEAAGGILPWN